MDSPVISTPFQSVLDTVGPQHEKALKTAFYNAAALLFVVICAAITLSAYYILEVFIRPLVWAALVGAFLHPFKYMMTKYVRYWLDTLENDGIPLVVGLTLLPFQAINESSDFLGWLVKSNMQLLICVFVLFTFSYYFIVYHVFHYIPVAAQFLNLTVSKLLVVFSYPIAIWTIFFGFLVLAVFHRKDQPENIISRNQFLLKYVSVGVWTMMLFHLVSLAGSAKVPLAILLIVLMMLGVVTDKTNKECENEVTEGESEYENLSRERRLTIVEMVDAVLNIFGIKTNSIKNEQELPATDSLENLCEKNKDETDGCIERAGPVHLSEANNEDVNATPNNQHQIHLKLPQRKERKRRARRSSDPYFIALFWLFVLTRLWLHTWLLQILPVLFFIFIFKTLCMKLTIYERLVQKTESFQSAMKSFYENRKEILLPDPVKRSISIVHVGDQKMISLLCKSTDAFMSVVMILCLLIIAVLGTTFFAIQVQHEGSYLVTVAINVFNRTVVSNEDYLRWLNLNDSEIRETFDTTVHNGYMMARHKMAVAISSTLMAKNSSSQKLEDEITILLDQLYTSWIAKHNESTLKVNRTSSNVSLNSSSKQDFWGQKLKIFSGLLQGKDFSKMAIILKENVGTLYSVFDSVWMLFKGNASLLISITSHVLSIIFSSGTYLVNGAVSIIIFTTTLFYLLSSSRKVYKPLEWFSGLSMGTRLGESVDKAVQDVFGASLKMATFYGFYTWLTHSVLGANLVFIPAAFAAMLGVVPFIGTYWAAVPAALELFLIQDEGVVALLLLVLHFLPTYVVDTAIYSEIGGHPYMTGLAVAGGVICVGLEGAFVGPFVLCSLVAAFDIYNRILNNTGSSVSPFNPKGENPFPKGLKRAFSQYQ